MGADCTSFLFDIPEAYNRFYMHNFSFKCTQTVRLLIILLSMAIWCLLIYVWVKACIEQLQFYILTIWLFAIARLSWSAGREVMEKKLLMRRKYEMLSNKTLLPEDADTFDLPEEEKTQAWRSAMLGYSLAAPLVIASPIMYAIYNESMFEGEVCKFYELAKNTKEAQEECLGMIEGIDGY